MDGAHRRGLARAAHGRRRRRPARGVRLLSGSTALVTGAAGQDGVLLARLLCRRGLRVVGTVQPGSPVALAPYLDGIEVVEHDLRDHRGFEALVRKHRPDAVYNLAGFTSVGASWDHADLVHAVNAVAVEHMLATLPDDTRFLQASSSEVYGPDAANPQDETTPHRPVNPYGESKSRAQAATADHRARGRHASTVVLYNHESELRGRQFVTRKIIRAAVEIAEGLTDSVTLGNLDVSRDWGSAHDYVAAMAAVVEHDVPDDYVVATGRLHTMGQLLEVAFSAAAVDDPWSYVRQDPALMRKADAPGLSGDATRARTRLGWQPTTSFDAMITRLVDVERRRVRTGVEEDVSYLEG